MKGPRPVKAKSHSVRLLAACLVATAVSIAATDQAEDLCQRCRQNLKLIGDALAVYRQSHQGEFPRELGDLVAESWLTDPNHLKCPATDVTGQSQVPPERFPVPGEGDGRVVGYNYELSRSPTYWEGNSYEFSFYRFKQLQRNSLAGGNMPIVRCLHEVGEESRWLNLAADGSVYESGLYWESEFVDILPGPRLAPELVKWGHLPMRQLVRPRPQGATAAMLDLRSYYNARFDDPWINADKGEELISFILDLREGLYRSDQTVFEPAGIIQLNGRIVTSGDSLGYERLMYPTHTPSIRLGRAFKLMHVLGGVLFESPADTVVARLRFFQEDRQPAALWEWRYGVDVNSLGYNRGDEDDLGENAHVAWVGQFERKQKSGSQARMFHLQFVHPHPDQPVSHFEFHAGDGVSSPFIAAITLE